MKIFEAAFLCCWLITILISQFHDLTKDKLKIPNYLGFFPNFHLFSPKPFLGTYSIKYHVFDLNDKSKIIRKDTLKYTYQNDFFNANKKTIKCLHNLIKGLPKSLSTNNNYFLMLNYIKKEIKKDVDFGQFEFLVFVKYNQADKLIFKSKLHDL